MNLDKLFGDGNYKKDGKNCDLRNNKQQIK
jgi:hypothetical protein